MQLPAVSPPASPRDRYLDDSYWSRWVDFTRKRLLELEQSLLPYRDEPSKRTAYRYEFEWRGLHTLVRQLYSGGYTLAEVAACVDTLFASVRDLAGDYALINPAQRYALHGWGYGTDYELMLQNLCWLYCLGHAAALDHYLAHCNPVGEDRLLDLIAAKLRVRDGVGSQVAFPKRAAPLLAVLDAPEADRPALLVKAFQQWKRRLPDRGRPPADATTTLDGSYTGYWYWDGALLAALFDIDDDALRNDRNYPGDLVTHARQRKP